MLFSFCVFLRLLHRLRSMCTGSVEGDRAALDAFYEATNGSRWRNNNGWTNSDLSSRYGVTVNDKGRVIKLVLRKNGVGNGSDDRDSAAGRGSIGESIGMTRRGVAKSR